MATAADIFGTPKALVGMVHLQALPGTPRNNGNSVQETAERAVREASLLAEAGFDALVLENMHDVPYLRRRVGPEIVAAMTYVVDRVRQAIDLPLGVQVLAGANREALAIAHAAGAQFIRAEGFVYAAVADEGLLDEADAGELLRFRKAIGAENVKILADVKKKHSAHAITADIELAEFARAAQFFHADGVIVTGTATGRPTRIDDVRVVRTATTLPLAIGSGVTPDNARDLLDHADALIVGSWYKQRGDWQNDPDPKRVADLVKAVERARL
jgi:membrane complex biogenesis BtpA family protein